MKFRTSISRLVTRRKPLASGAAVAAAAALIAPAASTAAISSAKPKPTLVLVHGGFADASGWNGVIKRLQHNGYTTLPPANPLRGLRTDAPYLGSVLKSVEGPICALLGKYPGSQIGASVQEVPYSNPDGTTGVDLYLRPDTFRSAFTADRPHSTTRIMQVIQRPFSPSALSDVTQAAAWRTIPSWAMGATGDKAIPPALERFFYQRAKARVIKVKGASHVPVISHPGSTARLIQSAAKATD